LFLGVLLQIGIGQNPAQRQERTILFGDEQRIFPLPAKASSDGSQFQRENGP